MDYAAEYTVVIRKLVSLTSNLELKSNHSDVQAVKAMVIDMAHTMSRLVSTVETLVQEVSHLKSKVRTVYEKQDVVIALTTTFDVNGEDNIVTQERASSSHTRQVSTTVPACVISCYRATGTKHTKTCRQ
jgi:hypothetical protein